MIVYERLIRFEDVDPAGIVYFGKHLTFAHEAMEEFFSALPGGYPELVMRRQVGFPAVDVRVQYHQPLRMGDRIRVEMTVQRLGRRSVTFHYAMKMVGTGVLAAEVTHIVVVSDLSALKSSEMPGDIRALLEQHRVAVG